MRSLIAAIAPVLALLPLCWLPTILLGGAEAAPPLWFFGPILLAAARGGALMAVPVALASGLAAGPLTPADVEVGSAQPTSDWLVRTAFFVASAVVTARLFARVQAEAERHRAAREDAEHGAALLRDLALRDSLTGLPNRALLAEHLGAALARARRHGDAVALLYIDLDDFKLVNDSLGHGIGDQLLHAVAERLSGCLRSGDVLARHGGDEFLLMLAGFESTSGSPGAAARDAATAAFERIHAALQQPHRIGDAELVIGASAGASIFPDDAEDAETLHSHADAAMYRAKATGAGLALYDDSAGEPLARLSLAARLRRAVDLEELELHYQPIFRLERHELLGVEALVRWRDPERGLVPPADFIPVAEKTGVIDAVGDWVLAELCAQARRWLDLGFAPNFGINVSPGQLRRARFAARFTDEIRAHGLDAGRFVLELTESAWTIDADRTRQPLDELRAGGVALAIDDFGAGYSSLSRLRELPVDVLKVDRTFLDGVPENDQATAIVKAIQGLAETCGCDVVAEGVETAAQRDYLVGIGVPLGQGFGLARPAPAAQITPLLGEHLIDARRAPSAVA